MAILTPLLPLLIKIVLWLFDRAGVTKETKKKFLEVIAHVEKELNISVKLNEDDRQQADYLRGKWQEYQDRMSAR